MGLSPGARLGPYEIVSPLGAGGMGEVYRARDSRLNRTVAIKVLPTDAAGDADRRERFEREAKAISALDHPNICALYDVGEHDGTYFLVMPCLEGQTLADRIAKGTLPVDQAIKIAIEIATALDAAHRHGIVHRDLKPGNVMLTKTGVKLLDFGLAKLKKAEGPLGHSTMVTGTGVGTLLGTMPYMSPEQVEGRDVDARSDIFSLGAVIYEMVTGERAFKGETAASVIGAILKDHPEPMRARQPLTPVVLERMVATCLAKQADDRWQSAADVARALQWSAEWGSDAASIVRERRSRLPMAMVGVAGLVIGAIAAAGWPSMRPVSSADAVLRFGIEPGHGLSFVGSSSSVGALQFAVSPDGRHVVLVAARDNGEPTLWLRTLNDRTSRELPGSAGATEPFWSPDSLTIGFFAGGRLKSVHIGTGEIRDICQASRSAPRGGAWSQEGVILFGADFFTGLSKVTVATGLVEPATQVDGAASSHRWPSFLPDGRRFLFYARGSENHRGIFLGSLDGTSPVRVLDTVFNGQYANGFLLTVRAGALLAYPFDERGGTISGDPLVHSGSTNELSRLTWFDRDGRETDPQLPPSDIATFQLSPDSRQVAMTRMDPALGSTDIWIADLERATSARFTLDPANDLAPTWSADGKEIIFRSDRTGENVLYRKASSGGATDNPVGRFNAATATDVSPDGRHVLFYHTAAGTGADIRSAPLSEPDQQVAIANNEYDEYDGRYSPDGRWIAYVSNESGRAEIYVQPLPSTGTKTIVSTNGGTEPRWRGDGRELFYLAADGKLMAVALTPVGGIKPGAERALFQTRILTRRSLFRVSVDASADGNRFLLKTPIPDAQPPSLTVVTNWTATLAR